MQEEQYTIETLQALMDEQAKETCRRYSAAHHLPKEGTYALSELLFLRPPQEKLRIYPSRVYSITKTGAAPLYLTVFSNYNIQMYVTPVLYKNISLYDSLEKTCFKLEADRTLDPAIWRLYRFYSAKGMQRQGLGNIVLREFLHLLPPTTKTVVMNAQATTQHITQTMLMKYYTREMLRAGYPVVNYCDGAKGYNMEFKKQG